MPYLQVAKFEQLACKRFFIGAFANMCFSMLGVGNVKYVVAKKTIYVSSVKKLFLHFFVN